MKLMRWYRFIALFWALMLVDPSWISSQTSSHSYQMIFETQGVYNHLNGNSKINPNNVMGINDFNSFSQLYPILSFKDTLNNINTLLQIEGNFKNYNFERDSTIFSFQELYGQISLSDKHYFIIGKKRLDWGTGLVWNPTNFFTQKDPLRTQNRLEGIFMMNYNYLLPNGALNVYLFPDKSRDKFKFAIKYDYSGNKIDASLSFLTYSEHQQYGIDFSYGGDYFTAYTEGVLRNFTKTYGVNVSGLLVEPERQKGWGYSEVVIGTSVLLTSNSTFNLEYRYRGDYLNKKEINYYKSHLPNNSIIYDPISMGQHTIFGSIEYKDSYGRWSVNLRSFYDPVSNQLVISPLGVLSMNNFQFELSTLIYNNSLSICNFQTNLLLSYAF